MRGIDNLGLIGLTTASRFITFSSSKITSSHPTTNTQYLPYDVDISTKSRGIITNETLLLHMVLAVH
jgi:hypothetical protein